MDELHAMLDEGLSAEEAFVGNQAGDVSAAMADAAQVVEADYFYPWQHHVTMEPMNATALYDRRRAARSGSATQDAEAALAAASETPRASTSPQCDVHRINLGGGFGRRASSATNTRPRRCRSPRRCRARRSR